MMGSRGRDSGANQKQMTLDMTMLMIDVKRIKEEADAIRSAMDSSGGGGGVQKTKMKLCFCCEEYSIPAGTVFESCPVCGWIDDEYQNKNPDSLKGRNPISLNEAREEYRTKNQASPTI